MKRVSKKIYYLQVVHGGVEPQIVGKFNSYKALLNKAQTLWANELSQVQDSIFYLALENEKLEVCSFTNSELEDATFN